MVSCILTLLTLQRAREAEVRQICSLDLLTGIIGGDPHARFKQYVFDQVALNLPVGHISQSSPVRELVRTLWQMWLSRSCATDVAGIYGHLLSTCNIRWVCGFPRSALLSSLSIQSPRSGRISVTGQKADMPQLGAPVSSRRKILSSLMAQGHLQAQIAISTAKITQPTRINITQAVRRATPAAGHWS